MAILESRSGETDLKNRAGLTLRYGYGWGHNHHDNLNVEFWAHNQPVVPEIVPLVRVTVLGTYTAFAPMLSVPPLTFTAPVPNAEVLATAKVPDVIVLPPLKVFEPDSVNVPVPLRKSRL